LTSLVKKVDKCDNAKCTGRSREDNCSTLSVVKCDKKKNNDQKSAAISCLLARNSNVTKNKGAITSKIKHATKLKTNRARLAQLLQPSLAFCFSLQPMTAYGPVLDGTPSLAAS